MTSAERKLIDDPARRMRRGKEPQAERCMMDTFSRFFLSLAVETFSLRHVFYKKKLQLKDADETLL